MTDIAQWKQIRRPRIKTRFLILSDTHSALPDPINQPHLPFSEPFPPADVAIHSGDLTSTGKLEEHRRAVQLLKSLPAPLKIVIPGNHDLTLDRDYCKDHPILYGWTRPHTKEDLQEALSLYTNEEAAEAGIIYVVEGTHSFALPNGAILTVYVCPWTPEFCDWGWGYSRDVDIFYEYEKSVPAFSVQQFNEGDPDNLLTANHCTVMVTHGPPRGILDKTMRGENVGCDFLEKAVGSCRPILHCFGHIHEGWGSERMQWPSRRHDITIPPLEMRVERAEALARMQGLTGKELKEFIERQIERREELADTRMILERKIRYQDEEAVVEIGENDPSPLTEQQQESVGYVDASTMKHGLETVFANASIMDVHYNPCQKPWVVDLMLPAATEWERERECLSIHCVRDKTARREMAKASGS